MNSNPLENLPDELLLDIVEYLDTAHHVSNLAASSRHTRDVIERNGWKTFVKTRFPSLTIPTSSQRKWSNVADRLTYQDICWEKRGFWMNVYYEKRPHQRRYQRTPMGQSVSFHTVLDSRLSNSGDHEILAAGVGENLMIRLRPENRASPDVWHQLQGKSHGYSAGTGDVTAVSIIERQGSSEVVVGRANGGVQLLSADDGFTKPRLNLMPLSHVEVNGSPDLMRKSPGQLAVSWTEWQPQSNLLASCKGSLMMLYDLSNEENKKELSPMAHHDFSKDRPSDEACLVREAKFLSRDLIACALGGSREPIRWSKVAPYGVEFMNSAKNARLFDHVANLTTARFEDKITVRAIEPVKGAGSESLILSAWDDGTYRLFDVRTPSPQDAIYRDRFQPYEPGSSLLVYGTERFVAGSNIAPDLKLFDFRYPKPYHYTTALPCFSGPPEPVPKDVQKSGALTSLVNGSPALCNSGGQTCPWHRLSKSDHWRPDATLHVGQHTYDRIYCLSKASDVSNTIYCGLRGAFMEMNIQLTTDINHEHAPPTVPNGWKMGRPGGKVSLIETGIGLCRASDLFDGSSVSNLGVPDLIVQHPRPRKKSLQENQLQRHRLDYAFTKI